MIAVALLTIAATAAIVIHFIPPAMPAAVIPDGDNGTQP